MLAILACTGAAIASLLVALVILEVVLRLRDGIPLLKFDNFVEERVSLTRVEGAMLEYDALVGWKYRKNQSLRSKDRHGNVQTWTTDEHGFRMNTDQVRPVPNDAIVAVGDSFAVGAEVSDDGSWPAFLERALEEPVINAGGASGADQIVLQAERLANAWQPHLVVLSFQWRDILRSEYALYAGAHKPYFSIEDDHLVHHNNPVPVYEGNAQEIGWARAILGYSHLMTWATQRLGHDTWLISHALQYQRAHPEALNSPCGVGVEISCRLLERLKKKADRDNFRLIFLMQYGSTDFEANGIEVTAPPPHALAVSACAADDFGIETVDRWDAIKAIYDSDRARWRDLWVLQADDKTLGHMSRSGNELMAQHLLELLR